jgi:hypothetical protein
MTITRDATGCGGWRSRKALAEPPRGRGRAPGGKASRSRIRSFRSPYATLAKPPILRPLRAIANAMEDATGIGFHGTADVDAERPNALKGQTLTTR